MTSALVDQLKTKRVITVNELEDTLNTYWVGRQERKEYSCVVEKSALQSGTEFP